jgi:hypothetical protein
VAAGFAPKDALNILNLEHDFVLQGRGFSLTAPPRPRRNGDGPMKLAWSTAMASALALTAAAPVAAQTGTPYRPTDEYLREQQKYQAQSQANQAAQQDYAAARARYDRDLTDWEARRAAYDARYGSGAYARIYPAPAWDQKRYTTVVVPQRGAGATVVVPSGTPAAGSYGAAAGATVVVPSGAPGP